MSPRCRNAIKGVEVNTSNGAVFDSELRHGVLQLQYALPSLTMSLLRREMREPIITRRPFFFVPLLVTNAPLFVVKKQFDMAFVRRTDSVAELGYPVPCVALRITDGPDFRRHATKTLHELEDLSEDPRVKEVAQYRAGFKRVTDMPDAMMRILSKGVADGGVQYHKIIVCNLDYLGRLLIQLQDIAFALTSNAREKPQRPAT